MCPVKQVLGNRVLVSNDVEKETKTPGGIIIPDTNEDKKMKTTTSEVIAIGTKLEENVEVGDIICFDVFAGTPIVIEGKDYLFVKGDNILSVLA